MMPRTARALLLILMLALTSAATAAAHAPDLGPSTVISADGPSAPFARFGNLTLGNQSQTNLSYQGNRMVVNGTDWQFNSNTWFGANKGVLLKADSTQAGMTLGSITRLITLQATGDYDRPWMTWLNASGRNMASVGWHYKNVGDDVVHNQWEIKTSGAPGGLNASDMRTRFSIDSDVDLGTAGFGYTNILEVQRTWAQDEGITLRYRSDTNAEGTASTRLMDLTAFFDSGNNTIVALDPYAIASGQGTSSIRLFRNTNAAAADFSLFAADGTNTKTFTVNPRTGDLTKAGTGAFSGALTTHGILTANGTTPQMRFQTFDTAQRTIATLKASVGGSGETMLNLDPVTTDGTKNAQLRLFRETSTTGARSIFVYKGDGTGTTTFAINADNGAITQSGPVTSNGTLTLGPSGSTATFQAQSGGSGETLLNIETPNGNPAAGAQVRLFRTTNLTGAKTFTVFKGDGTNTPVIQLSANGGISAQNLSLFKDNNFQNLMFQVNGNDGSISHSGRITMNKAPVALLDFKSTNAGGRAGFNWYDPSDSSVFWHVDAHTSDDNVAATHMSFYGRMNTQAKGEYIENLLQIEGNENLAGRARLVFGNTGYKIFTDAALSRFADIQSVRNITMGAYASDVQTNADVSASMRSSYFTAQAGSSTTANQLWNQSGNTSTLELTGDVSAWPATFGIVQFAGGEKMLYTARSGSTLTNFYRGYAGTNIDNHSSVGEAVTLLGYVSDNNLLLWHDVSDGGTISEFKVGMGPGTSAPSVWKVNDDGLVTMTNDAVFANKQVAATVTETSTTKSVTLQVTEPNTSYGVTCTPNWGTTVWVTTKTTTSYVVNFGTAAPASATVDCVVYR